MKKESQPGAATYSAQRIRRGLVHFAGGRVVSAALTFSVFALAARVLQLEQYGYYVAALSLMELGMALATFGLDWVAVQAIPEFRVKASGRQLLGFIRNLAALQCFVYILVGGLFLLLAGWVSAWLKFAGGSTLFSIYAVLIVIEGCGRMLRDQMLQSLLYQGAAQLAQILRTLAVLLGLAFMYINGLNQAQTLAWIELAAALLALLFAGTALALRLYPLRLDPATEADWQPKALKDYIRLALHTYVSYLFALAYGPQVMALLASRYLGAEVTAVLGFARSFADQLRRFLPTDMLLGFLRPALVAHFVATRDFRLLAERLRLIFKLSLLALIPLLVCFIAYGEILAGWLGSGHFSSAGPALALLIMGLVGFAHRRILEMLANTVSLSSLLVRAGSSLLLVPLAMFLSLNVGGGLYWLLGIALAGELLFSVLVMRGLQQEGYGYHIDGLWAMKVVSLVSLFGGVLVLLPLPASLLPRLLLVGLTLPLVWAGMWVSGVFGRADVDLCRQLLKK